MHSALDGARLKIARAVEHIRDFEREARAYLMTEPYDVVRNNQGATSATAIRIRVAPPHHLSTIVGDSLYNLRAALELIFWELALGTGPKDPNRDRISFPIYANESKFAAAQEALARCIPAEAVDIVLQVQPFRTRNAALSVLRTLSNQDRHGFLALTVIGAAGEPPAAVALNDSRLPPVDMLLHKIERHISADVLPKFVPLFDSPSRERGTP